MTRIMRVLLRYAIYLSPLFYIALVVWLLNAGHQEVRYLGILVGIAPFIALPAFRLYSWRFR